MRAAGYSSTLSSQVASFRKNGYVLIRKAPTATPELVASINSEVTNHFNDIESSYKYRFWRFCNSVSTPLKRHSIPLELSSGVRKLLTANVTHVGPFLETQLSTDSPLVELSAIISQSGSLDQDTHSDVPLSSPLILSAFIALTPVTLENGPTCIYRGSHTAAFHHAKAEPTANKHHYYSTDGYDEELKEFQNDIRSDNEKDSVQISTQEKEDALAIDYPPYVAVLEPGDMLLFDTKIAHHGLANNSSTSRSLLCFAFQEPDAENSSRFSTPVEGEPHTVDIMTNRLSPRVEGFTYHCHTSMTEANLKLSDFLQ